MQITIERGKKKYRVHLRGDCSEKCSFVRFKNGEYCPEQCFLPKWFADIVDKIMSGGYYPFLEEVDNIVRNCDKYRTIKEQKEAYNEYRSYVICSNSNPFIAQYEMLPFEKWRLEKAR
jgi:hypothetical protein